jgi:large subunit ribosomal protein L18
MDKSDQGLQRKIRHRRVRKKVTGTVSRPRLCVFRSLRHTYAQVIDDGAGRTLTSMSTLDPAMREKTVGMAKVKNAEAVGSLLAEKALAQGIDCVVFDRGGYRYHGRVKAFAEAARRAGLKF